MRRRVAALTTTPGTEALPAGRLRAALLVWSALASRDLPWRRTRDPWAVLVSELMLQQTQVARVIPRWHAFLERFPTARSCAAAPAGDVLRLWAGLGYNRRALNLHRAAGVIAAEHGGHLPEDLVQLQALPGVGSYTARAVLAFAFGHDVGVLDTNAARVLARISGRALRAAEAQRLADHLVPAGHGWAWNQAMLDLGATTCTARDPACGRCPLGPSCRWSASGRPLPDPAQGSAGVSGRQGPFAGSDRQGRGRLVHALRQGPVALDPAALAAACGWPADPERAVRIVGTLLADGLVAPSNDGRWLTLPT